MKEANKAKKQFFVVGKQYVLYLLDNRDGHIKEAERNVFVLDLSYVGLDELPEMTERDLFMNSADDISLISADEVF